MNLNRRVNTSKWMLNFMSYIQNRIKKKKNLPELQRKHPNQRVHLRSIRWLYQAQRLSLAWMVAVAVVVDGISAVVLVHRTHHHRIRKNLRQTFSTSKWENNRWVERFSFFYFVDFVIRLIEVFLRRETINELPSVDKTNKKWFTQFYGAFVKCVVRSVFKNSNEFIPLVYTGRVCVCVCA